MSERKKILNNMFWRFLERTGAQGVTFIVGIVLARLLDPSAYGVIALITVFTAILQVFIDSGLGVALIQKKDADDVDFSTVFFFNIAMCLFLYLVMFFAAPFIADFYSMSELTPMIRVLSFTLIISGIKNVQQAFVSRNLIFKKFFFATLGGTIGAAIIGIILAYLGFGAWALIAQNLFNATIDTIILWVTVKWRPKFVFSFSRFKGLFSFGWKLLISTLIDTCYGQLRTMLIGKVYTARDLAFYHRGNYFPNLIVTNINTSIDSVLLPSMSSRQDDCDKVREFTRRAIKTSTYIMMPLMVGLAVCAEPIITLLLTEKWLPCVFFLRVACFTFAFYPVHTANLNAIKALGQSGVFLKLEIIKKVVGLIVLGSTLLISVKALALGGIVTSVVAQLINSWPNRKLLNYKYREQLFDMFPQIVCSLLMGLIVYSVAFLGLNNWLQLLIQVPLGAIIYISLSRLFHIDSFDYIIGLIRSYKKSKNN